MTFTTADAPATKANPHLIPLTYPTQSVMVSTTVTQAASSSSPERAPPKAEQFKGRGERLGGGGKGGDGDDDGNYPDDWKVVDDGRDSNANKQDRRR